MASQLKCLQLKSSKNCEQEHCFLIFWENDRITLWSSTFTGQAHRTFYFLSHCKASFTHIYLHTSHVLLNDRTNVHMCNYICWYMTIFMCMYMCCHCILSCLSFLSIWIFLLNQFEKLIKEFYHYNFAHNYSIFCFSSICKHYSWNHLVPSHRMFL